MPSAAGRGMSRNKESQKFRGGVADFNDILNDRRKLIAVGPEESDSDSDSDWDVEEGAVSRRWWWWCLVLPRSELRLIDRHGAVRTTKRNRYDS